MRILHPDDHLRVMDRGLCICCFVGLALNLHAQAPDPVDLGQASLEDLMNIKVTSVSKKEEKLSRTAAAVFVINSEDIRRSGATNIPDLLRMVPGVDVEQINANSWAISVRGFNSRYSNKVLVLIDGRTVYNPVFSGVLWDQVDLPLEDIDRIEVIRGPGGTVWGANAVNGVISIITKSSKDTKGGLLTAGGGSQTHALGEVQYGGAAGPSGTYRAYGSYFGVGNSASQTGGADDDRWQRSSAGFRSDWQTSKSDSLMVQGDLFANQEHQTTSTGFLAQSFDRTFGQTLDAAGGDVLALWKHTLAGGSQTSLQAYYDDFRRTDLGTPAKVRTFDLDFQHHLAWGDRQDIVWGLGYRSDTSSFATGDPIAFSPRSQSVNLFNVFVQDEIRLSDSVWFTLGVKLEHNSYTGFENEPSARLMWSPPTGRFSLWAAASKAIREPARVDTSIQLELAEIPLNAYSEESIRLVGNPKVRAEQLRDYELGYRYAFTKTLALDATSFLSFYHNLETYSPQAPIIIPGSPLIVEVPVLFGNQAHGMDYGGELAVSWKAASFWHITPGYAYLHSEVRLGEGPLASPSANTGTDFPGNTVQLRSQFNLSRKTEFDQSLYYTARLPGGAIPGHARLDLRLARHFGESTEVSLVAQNLLQPRTLEYGDASGVQGAESIRSVFAKITFHF